MIETFLQPLPHGITLSCRAAGARGRPVLLFLHGFPEAAFVWDDLLAHFAKAEHGGYRCVAPNLRGFEASSAPADVSAYRAKHLVQDIAALIRTQTAPASTGLPTEPASTALHTGMSPETAPAGDAAPLDCLIAHDWGGAIAWSLANQQPHLIQRLAIVNSPHPAIFLRELQSNPGQQAASAYMNFLIRPDAERLLAQNDYRRLWEFFTNGGGAAWLTEAVKQQYRAVWDGDRQAGAVSGTDADAGVGAGLRGGCNYYRASPLRPPRPEDAGAAAITLPPEMLTIGLPTFVLWAMNDAALLPGLIDGLAAYIPNLRLEKVADATHWIVHERPQFVAERLAAFLRER